MPVILPTEGYSEWLSLEEGTESLTKLLTPYPSSQLQAYPVSTIVNSAAIDQPECVEEVPALPKQLGLF
jgi:putative SOS response-associated peptidase YedK